MDRVDTNATERSTDQQGAADPFDGAVRLAMRRIDAPTGFADRVLERAGALPSTATAARLDTRQPAAAHRGPAQLFLLRRPAWRAAWAAAAVLAVTAGTLGVHHHHAEQVRANAAAAQFDEALTVTNHALNQIGDALQRNDLDDVERALPHQRGGKQ